MDAIEGLLNGVGFKIGTLREARKRFSAQLAPSFNLFDYLRTDEMGISKAIADLLDPKGAHGQGKVFLQAFAKTLGQEWITSTSEWRVVTERQANGQRRLDVYLESDIGVIGIENKPWAADQKNQLSDYADYLKMQAANREWRLIYLGNNEPSADSISKAKREILEQSGNLVCLDFHVIEGWLGDCAAQSRALVVRVFVEELTKFVRININGELDMSEENEVIGEIQKSPENIAAAFQVSNAMNAFKQGLLQLFRDELKSKLAEKGFFLEWDQGMTKGWGGCVGFGVKFGSQDKHLRIEFEGSGLYRAFWGIRRDNKSIESNSNTWQGIQEVMQNQFGNGKQSNWWPWYSEAPDSVFDKGYKNWGASEKPWIEMKNGELTKKIVELSVRVHNEFQKNEGLHLLSSKAE